MPSVPYYRVLVHLLDQIPELEVLYWQYQDLFSDGISPYGLMHQVEEFTEHLAQTLLSQETQDASTRGLLERILRFVDEMRASDNPDVSQLIALGFLEYLSVKDPTYPLIGSLLGTSSRWFVKESLPAFWSRVQQDKMNTQERSVQATGRKMKPTGSPSATELLAAYEEGRRDFPAWNLRSARLITCKLPEINLQEANLVNARLAGADLRGANLERADLTGADLQGANLSRANLTGANLTEANLTNTDFNKAHLFGACLEYTSLRQVHFTKADLREVNLEDALITYGALSEANLHAAKLAGITLIMGCLRKANLSEADLSKADLTYADLREADLTGANLRGAILEQANLEGANLEGVIFAGPEE